MRRSTVLAIAALSACGLAAPAQADPFDTLSGSTPAAAYLPDPFNPPADGGDSRHVCVISDKLDWYACVYVPVP